MNAGKYSHLLNFAWYQLLWFTAVAGGNSLAWILLGMLLVHLISVPCWRSEILLMAGVALLGLCVDSALTLAGLYSFEPVPQRLPVPLWLVAIWLGFAGTLRHSLAWLSVRPALMALMASVGAPLTYLAAARLGAVEFPLGAWPTAITVGLAWTALTPALCWLTACSQQLETRTPQFFWPLAQREVENG